MTAFSLPLDEMVQPFWTVASVFLRVGALAMVAPIIGERAVPVRIRLALALVMSSALAGTGLETKIPEKPFDLGLLIVAETMTGLTIGMGLRVFVMALHMAGSVAAQTTSLAQLMGNPSVDPMPAIAQILVVSGLALAASLGLHHDMLRLLALSFEVIPPGFFPDPRLVFAMGVHNAGEAMGLAFSCAAPFVAASLIYNLVLGVINRAMPQLMVAFVGAPAITLASMALLAATASGALLAWWFKLSVFILLPGAP